MLHIIYCGGHQFEIDKDSVRACYAMLVKCPIYVTREGRNKHKKQGLANEGDFTVRVCYAGTPMLFQA